MRWLSVLLLLLPSLSLARDPPVVSVREALARGRVAFIGRVVALRELKRAPPYVVQAEATVSIVRCLYGSLCKPKTLRVRHYLETGNEAELQVVLDFGQQYLFVLQTARAPGGSFDFRSTGSSEGLDLAWRIEDGSWSDFTRQSEPVPFTSLWGSAGGTPQELGLAQILSWANARRAP